MKRKYRWQNYFFPVIAIVTNIAAAYALITPTAGNQPVAEFKFPQYIKLNSQPQIIALNVTPSIDADTPKNQPEKIRAKQKYQYISQKPAIEFEVSYLVNTRGDVVNYLHQYTDLPPEAIEQQQIAKIPNVGDHILLNHSDRAYLSSCISPRSLSSVTQQQFSQYRYQNDLKLSVIWNWLQGKASIRDRRCLWVNLSTPIVSNPQAAYQTLEKTWQEFYHWWLPNFPQL